MNIDTQLDGASASVLRAAIRDVPDFPVPGVTFKDITPILASGAHLRLAIEAMAAPYDASPPTHVVAIESRGFLFGAPLAVRWRVGLIPVRKTGKLPAATEREEYALEYGSSVLEIHRDAFSPGSRVLIVDDVLATGGTAVAAAALVERLGGVVDGFAFLLSLDFLGGSRRLGEPRAHAVVRYG